MENPEDILQIPIDNIIVEPVVEQVVEPIIESVVEEPVVEPVNEHVVDELPKVVQNSDILYKSNIQWANNTEYIEPNDYEIKMLHGTKKPKEILEEESQEVIVMKTEEEVKKQRTKDLLLIFKVVSLNRLGHTPIMNTSYLQPYQLKDFLAMMNSLIEDFNKGLEVEITAEFNRICNEKLFSNGTDVSQYPVYV